MSSHRAWELRIDFGRADTPADGIADMPFRLCEVPKEAFRFFDGVRFEVT